MCSFSSSCSICSCKPSGSWDGVKKTAPLLHHAGLWYFLTHQNVSKIHSDNFCPYSPPSLLFITASLEDGKFSLVWVSALTSYTGTVEHFIIALSRASLSCVREMLGHVASMYDLTLAISYQGSVYWAKKAIVPTPPCLRLFWLAACSLTFCNSMEFVLSLLPRLETSQTVIGSFYCVTQIRH